MAYRAFWDLHEDREISFVSAGMASTAIESFIPVAAILAYSLGEDLDFSEVRRDVRVMDRAYLKRQREIREAERERSERAAKLRGRNRGARR